MMNLLHLNGVNWRTNHQGLVNYNLSVLQGEVHSVIMQTEFINDFIYLLHPHYQHLYLHSGLIQVTRQNTMYYAENDYLLNHKTLQDNLQFTFNLHKHHQPQLNPLDLTSLTRLFNLTPYLHLKPNQVNQEIYYLTLWIKHLITNPQLIIMFDLFKHLSYKNHHLMTSFINGLIQEGKTFIMISERPQNFRYTYQWQASTNGLTRIYA